jgi:hypothetical protein
MIKSYLRILAFIFVAMAALWIINRIIGWPSLSGLFKSQPIRIAETPLQVEKIRELAELTTMVSIDEVVVDSSRPAAPSLSRIFQNPLGPQEDRLVLVVRGFVKAGVDLQKLTDQDLYREKDSLRISLPRAGITEVLVNPSGTETFIETGTWNTSAFSALVEKAGMKMRDRAVSEGIIGKADQRARQLVANLLRQSGFQKISVHTRYP